MLVIVLIVLVLALGFGIVYGVGQIFGGSCRPDRLDVDTDRELASAGWLAVRVWEHELSGPGAMAAAERVKEVLSGRRARFVAINDAGRPVQVGPG